MRFKVYALIKLSRVFGGMCGAYTLQKSCIYKQDDSAFHVVVMPVAPSACHCQNHATYLSTLGQSARKATTLDAFGVQVNWVKLKDLLNFVLESCIMCCYSPNSVYGPLTL